MPPVQLDVFRRIQFGLVPDRVGERLVLMANVLPGMNRLEIYYWFAVSSNQDSRWLIVRQYRAGNHSLGSPVSELCCFGRS
jgi:hypothetical protein